uniref:Radical SAM domain protein n=1 Tax=Solibacter usitatus (strain Ellin6076) TaxID=234267 RepID=Q01Z17_SOLUE
MESTRRDRRGGVTSALKTLSIMPTFTCPAACADCASLSSPRDRTNVRQEAVLAAIREARELGFYNVVFTGGEATLRWKDLLEGIRLARSLDFPVRLVTNAHWAHDPERATQGIGELLEAGLTEINYSTGDEHARFIPVERVLHAIAAATARGLHVVVVVELRAERLVTRAALEGHPLYALLSSGQKEKIRVLESPWMPLEPYTVERYPEGVAIDRRNLAWRPGCDNLMQTYTLQADGRIGCCCGIGMRRIDELNVGNVSDDRPLHRAIEEAENDFLKLWIRWKGPERVLAWAASIDPAIRWEGMYAHHCQACARVYRDPRVAAVIREHYESVMADVIQSGWMDEEFVPGVLQQPLVQIEEPA